MAMVVLVICCKHGQALKTYSMKWCHAAIRQEQSSESAAAAAAAERWLSVNWRIRRACETRWPARREVVHRVAATAVDRMSGECRRWRGRVAPADLSWPWRHPSWQLKCANTVMYSRELQLERVHWPKGTPGGPGHRIPYAKWAKSIGHWAVKSSNVKCHWYGYFVLDSIRCTNNSMCLITTNLLVWLVRQDVKPFIFFKSLFIDSHINYMNLVFWRRLFLTNILSS